MLFQLLIKYEKTFLHQIFNTDNCFKLNKATILGIL